MQSPRDDMAEIPSSRKVSPHHIDNMYILFNMYILYNNNNNGETKRAQRRRARGEGVKGRALPEFPVSLKTPQPSPTNVPLALNSDIIF